MDLETISTLFDNVDFIKGFIFGAFCGFFGMVFWRKNRIKELQEDLKRDREYYLQEIERLKRENTSLIINQSAKHFNP